MKTIITRLAIASTAILTATIGFNSIAQAGQVAATAEMTFGGGVATVCSFSNAVPGRIGISNNNNRIIGSDANFYQNAGGGTVDIVCNGNAALSVADSIQLSGPTTTTQNAARITTAAGQVSSPADAAMGTGFTQSLPLPTGYYSGLTVDTFNSVPVGQQIAGGTYSYKVVISATPN